MIERKIFSSFFFSAILHAGAGAGLLGFALLPPALPVKKGVSALVLDLSSTPVCIAKTQNCGVEPKKESVPSPDPIILPKIPFVPSTVLKTGIPAPSVIPVKTGIQNPLIPDCSGRAPSSPSGTPFGRGLLPGFRRNDRIENNADSLDKGVREVEAVGILQPRYPWLSRKKGEEGEVVVTVRVSAEGRMEDCNIARSSGFIRLDNAALEAVSEATFFPASNGGSAVASSKQWVFDFRLEEGTLK